MNSKTTFGELKIGEVFYVGHHKASGSTWVKSSKDTAHMTHLDEKANNTFMPGMDVERAGFNDDHHIDFVSVCFDRTCNKWRYELIMKDGTCWTLALYQDRDAIIDEATRFCNVTGLRGPVEVK